MEKKINISLIISIVNFFAIVGLFFLFNSKINNEEALTADDFDEMLEDSLRENPKLLIDILNEAANKAQNNKRKKTESLVFKNFHKIKNSGFYVKKINNADSKTLAIFMDMTCSNCISFLKNVKPFINSLDCSVILIPISFMGEKSEQEAKIITAASLQNPLHAIDLIIAYNGTLENSNNNRLAEAEKLGFDLNKLSLDSNNKTISEIVKMQTELSQEIDIPGVPSAFLITNEKAFFIPPSDGESIKNFILNPKDNDTHENTEEY